METILVTGGAGFIGSNVAETLVSRGYRVVVLDDLSSGRLDNIDLLLHNKHFTFIRGSVLDRGLLRSIMKSYQVSGVSHQAAVTSVTKSIIDPVRTIEVNVTGTANVFDIAAESRCRRVVFASSGAVYGESAESPRREQLPMNPKSAYAVTKAAGEMLARTFCDLQSVEIVGLRYFNVYGRRQNPSSDYAPEVPDFIAKALRNEPLAVEGDGLQSADFVFIDDVVLANVQALTAQNVSGCCFNISSGSETTILELARAVITAAGSASSIVFGPVRSGVARNPGADIEHARTRLGYSPCFSIAKGITDTVGWHRHQAGMTRRSAAAAVQAAGGGPAIQAAGQGPEA